MTVRSISVVGAAFLALAIAACGGHQSGGGGGVLPNTGTGDSAGSMAVSPLTATPAPGPSIFAEYPIGTPNSQPNGITAGPDGALWFTEDNQGASKIGRITTSGTMSEFSAGMDPDAGPYDIAAGPDGNLWFTEAGFTPSSLPGGCTYTGVGKITTSGTITSYTNGISQCGVPYGIVTGPDGNIWFTEFSANNIAKITVTGSVTEFPVAANSTPVLITTGPDTNLWFAETSANAVVRSNVLGSQTNFPDGSGPYGLATGPDGNIWVTDCSADGSADGISRVTPTGSVTVFTAGLTPASCPVAIVAGSDGNIWFTEFSGNNIGRITTAGVITEFAVTTPDSQPYFLASGSDGNIWFTEAAGNQIGKLYPSVADTLFPTGATPTPSPSPSPTPCFDPDDAHRKNAAGDAQQNPDHDCTKGPPAKGVKAPPPSPHPHHTPKPKKTPKPH